MIEFVAEIGWNHLGDIPLAKKMIDAAAEAGTQTVKFQTWSTIRLKQGSWDIDGRREIYKKAELSIQDHLDLISYCDSIRINFLTSVFSVEDAQLISSLNMSRIKIPSAESTNWPLLTYCLDNFRSLIISVGTCTVEEIKQIKSIANGHDVTILHCVSSYPCPIECANLNRIDFLQGIFENVGYSDHVVGTNAAKAACAHNVCMLEKHLTVDQSLPGRDNQFSILPSELKDLIQYSRDYVSANGDHGPGFQAIEEDTRSNYRNRFDKK
jgi:N,N'-diacetyllegionaminate synthase